jgi:hypothetical protein
LLKDKMQWGREHSVRYNQHRIEAYAEMLSRGRPLIDYPGPQDGPPNADGGSPVPVSSRDFDNAYELVKMVATQQVREAADEFYNALVCVMIENYQNGNSRSIVTEARSRLGMAKQSFYEAVRQERGTE